MTDPVPEPPAPEFSRPVSIARLGAKPAHYKIAANEAERAGLVARFGLVALDRLEAEVTLVREAGGAIRLEAALEADLAQPCVVTLEPVPEHVADSFTLLYRPGLDEAEADRLALENPEDEVVEPLMGDSIDIGEAVAQQLSVAMDPYPRAEGVELAPVEIGGDEAAPAGGSNPFDVLARLKR